MEVVRVKCTTRGRHVKYPSISGVRTDQRPNARPTRTRPKSVPNHIEHGGPHT